MLDNTVNAELAYAVRTRAAGCVMSTRLGSKLNSRQCDSITIISGEETQYEDSVGNNGCWHRFALWRRY